MLSVTVMKNDHVVNDDHLVESSKLGGRLSQGLPGCCWRGLWLGLHCFFGVSPIPNNRWFIRTKYPSLYRLRPEGTKRLRDLETMTQPAKWCWRSRSTKAPQEFAVNRNNTTSIFMVGSLWTDNYVCPASPCFQTWQVTRMLPGTTQHQKLKEIIYWRQAISHVKNHPANIDPNQPVWFQTGLRLQTTNAKSGTTEVSWISLFRWFLHFAACSKSWDQPTKRKMRGYGGQFVSLV